MTARISVLLQCPGLNRGCVTQVDLAGPKPLSMRPILFSAERAAAATVTQQLTSEGRTPGTWTPVERYYARTRQGEYDAAFKAASPADQEAIQLAIATATERLRNAEIGPPGYQQAVMQHQIAGWLQMQRTSPGVLKEGLRSLADATNYNYGFDLKLAALVNDRELATARAQRAKSAPALR